MEPCGGDDVVVVKVVLQQLNDSTRMVDVRGDTVSTELAVVGVAGNGLSQDGEVGSHRVVRDGGKHGPHWDSSSRGTFPLPAPLGQKIQSRTAPMDRKEGEEGSRKAPGVQFPRPAGVPGTPVPIGHSMSDVWGNTGFRGRKWLAINGRVLGHGVERERQ